MPLLRYFTAVGGALLALLFVVSSYFPKAETIDHGDAARPVIRIASDRVAPPRVDIDTRVQAAVVPTPIPDLPQQAATREVVAQPRAVVAQLSAPPAATAAPIKVERKKTKVARRPDHQRMAANPLVFQPFRLTW
jgi:hypothetical protein